MRRLTLIALGTSHKSGVESALMGSVGRKAVISAAQSVLIAKTTPPTGK